MLIVVRFYLFEKMLFLFKSIKRLKKWKHKNKPTIVSVGLYLIVKRFTPGFLLITMMHHNITFEKLSMVFTIVSFSFLS